MKIKKLFYFLFIIFFIVFNFGKSIKSEAFPVEKIKSDNEILESVKKILFLFNPKLRTQIKLEVHQGVVFLSGIINTLKDQEEAINIVKTVTGNGVIDYSILNPAICRDKDIKDNILVVFLDDPSIYAPDLGIQVLNGVVTLTGSVASAWEKEEAVNAAKGIVGVVKVVDRLSIDSQNKRLRRMEWLDIITTIFAQDRYLFDNQLNIKIGDSLGDGRIIVRGVVDTAMEKSLVSQKILALEIGEVDNQLIIEKSNQGYIQKASFNLNDSEIHRAIDRLIYLDERIHKGKDIVILVDNGVVSLQGRIANDYEREILKQDIRSVDGILFIKDMLITDETSRGDMDIVQDIKRAFGYEPDLAGADIMITCKLGKVTLNGELDLAAKDLAESLLLRVVGVKEFSNQIRIVPVSVLVKPKNYVVRSSSSNLINWNLEVENKSFQICIDKENETVTIRGNGEDLKQKDKVEDIVKSRAPSNFQIVNEIEIP
ncbi:MAG: BON domain-containing protein [bacterium]|nr:BON domain-containing protein [bacterium]